MNDDDQQPKNPAINTAKQAGDAVHETAKIMQDTAQRSASVMQEHAKRGMHTMEDVSRRTSEAGMAGMAEFTRMFSEVKWPAMLDMESFIAANRRNLETLTAANRVAMEGAQTVARRHMEIVQQTMQEMSETIRDLSTSESPQARAAKQAELIKHAYERAVAHIKELAELIQRSNGEALHMLNQRFAEAMDEVKAIADKSAAHSRDA